MNDKPDNVHHLRPHGVPGTPTVPLDPSVEVSEGENGMVRLKSDKPYTTPAAAIAEALKQGGFNQQVVNAGLVEIVVLAEFGENGCIIHQMRAARAYRPSPLGDAMRTAMAEARPVTNDDPPVESPAPNVESVQGPAFRVLRMMAEAHGKPPRHYILEARVGEMTLLDDELHEATDEELRKLVANDVHIINRWPGSHTTLDGIWGRS